MKKALFQYRILIIFVLVITVVSIGSYIVRFYEFGISSDTDNWANFATYISGTVGIAVVCATLIALIHTLHQQSILIQQQDDMLNIQRDQLAQTDTHQRRIEAYSRIEHILPKLVDSCSREYNSVVSETMNKYHPNYRSVYFPQHMILRDFFNSTNIFYNDDLKKDTYFPHLWKEYLVKLYNLATFTANCIEDAEELQTFIRDQTKSLDTAMACVVIYALSEPKHSENAKRISKILNYPTKYKGTKTPQEMWQNIGRAQHIPPEQRQ